MKQFNLPLTTSPVKPIRYTQLTHPCRIYCFVMIAKCETLLGCCFWNIAFCWGLQFGKLGKLGVKMASATFISISNWSKTCVSQLPFENTKSSCLIKMFAKSRLNCGWSAILTFYHESITAITCIIVYSAPSCAP